MLKFVDVITSGLFSTFIYTIESFLIIILSTAPAVSLNLDSLEKSVHTYFL